MEGKPVYGLRKYGKQLVAVALGIVALGTSQLVSADTWVANSPESIQVEAGATSYQLKWGDTLWAVSQKVNVSVETLAELSDVDLASGQQYHLPVGYTVRWNADQTKYQLVSPDDVVINEVEPNSTDSDVRQSKALDPTVVPDVDVNATNIKQNKAIVEQLSAVKNHKGLSAMVIHNDSTNEEVYIVPIPANQNTDESVSDDSQSIDDLNTGVNYLVLTAKDSKEVYTWAEFTKDKDIQDQKVGTVAIYTQADLEAYLLQTGLDLTGDQVWFYNDETIVFPRGTYILTNGYTDWSLPSAIGDIDFNGSTFLIGDGGFALRATGDQNNRTISNLIVYGTTGIDETYVYGTSYVNPYTESSRSGSWRTPLYHVSNLNFENMTFNNAQGVDSHIFDVMGSDNISFNNITVRGSALSTDLSQDYLTQLFNEHGHSVYSEALQIDSAVQGAMGSAKGQDGSAYSGFFDGSYDWASLFTGDAYDGVASSNISIINSEFTSYQGLTGLALINGTDQTVSKYGSGIGSHTVGNTGYQGIVIDNVIMEGTVAIDGVSNNELAPIKFLNSSYYQSGVSQDETVNKVDYIANDNVRDTTDISVTNVQYINTKTADYYNPSGETTATSVWTVYYDNDDNPDNNSVSQTTVVDNNGNVIQSVDGYDEVAPVISQGDTSYTLQDSNYNSETGELTRIYAEASNTTYDVSDEVVEVGTERTSSTTETAVDGSSVTVNTYENGGNEFNETNEN